MADTPNPMHDFGFDKGQGLEFGIYTPEDHLGDLGPFWPDSDVFPHLAIGGGP